MLTKRTILIFSILLALIFTLVAYYFGGMRNKGSQLNVYTFIDANVSFTFQFKSTEENLSNLKQNSSYVALLSSDLRRQLYSLDSTIRTSSIASNFLNQNVLIASFKVSAQSSSLLFVFQTELDQDFAKQMFPEAEIQDRDFESELIQTVVNESQNLSFAIVDGHLLISEHLPLIERAIKAKQESKSILNEPSLLTLLQNEEKGNDDIAKFLVNYRSLPAYAELYLKSGFVKQFSRISDAANFSVFQLQFQPTVLQLNGQILSNEQQYYSAFQGQSEQRPQLLKFLSKNTWAFESLVLSDFQMYSKRVSEIAKANRNFSLEAERKSIQNRYSLDINQWMWQHISGEMIRVYPNNWRYSKNSGEYFLFALNEPLRTQQFLVDQSNLRIEYRGREIFRFPFRKLPMLMAGPLFSASELQYASIVNDVLVAAADQASIERYINDVNSENYLKDFQPYINFSEKLNDNYNYLMVLGLKAYQKQIESISKASDSLSLVDSKFLNFQAFASMISSTEVGLIHHLYLGGQELAGDNGLRSKWQISLDHDFQSIELVQGQFNNSIYLLVQDDSNQVYLINDNSEILWKRQLDNKQIGQVQLIDYFRNGRAQVVFCSKTSLYLIDLEGKDVAAYPIKLPAETKQGLSVFDYDRNKMYRLFVPCLNGNVYGYDVSGRPLDGWNPKRLGNAVEPLQHQRVGQKDYIFFRSEANELLLLNRKSETIAKYRDSAELSFDGRFMFDSKGQFFAGTRVNGTLVRFFLDGRCQFVSLGEHSELHRYLRADVYGDANLESIFSEAGSLEVYQNDSVLVFRNEFEQELDHAAQQAGSGSNTLLMQWFMGANQLIVFNRAGQLRKEFPIPCFAKPTSFSISGGTYIVLKDDKARLCCYQIIAD